MAVEKRCKGPDCGAEIDFLEVAASGRKCIVDARPLLAWVPGPDGRVYRSKVYIDHHGTCPNAKSFYRKKAERQAEEQGANRADQS